MYASFNSYQYFYEKILELLIMLLCLSVYTEMDNTLFNFFFFYFIGN